MLYYSKVEGN